MEWYRDPMTLSTVAIAGATVINLLVSFLLWRATHGATKVTQQMFEASHRPYIGPLRIFRKDYDSPVTKLDIGVIYQNFGSVPASDTKPELMIITDGALIPVTKLEEEPALVIFPGIKSAITHLVDDPREVAAIENASSLAFVFKCNYKGVQDNKYYSEQRWVYDKRSNEYHIVKGRYT